MQKTGPGAKPLPTNKKSTAEYMTPQTLAGKKGVTSMGVPKLQVVDASQREKISETSEKNTQVVLNKLSMSNKSLFDKLFEDVMDESEMDFTAGGPSVSDEEALGIEGGDDLGSEGEDQVTITLDRATAEKLHSALGALLGGGDDLGGEEEFGGEETGEELGDEETGDEAMGESVSVEPEPKELKSNIGHFQKGKYEVGDVKASKGKAETGKVDANQPEPKAIGAKPDTLQKHGHQKVASKASQVGKRLFDV